eukprot:COSAG01_NODE_40764_length_459_cov_67.063889_1_plen_121_part_10
MSPAFPSCTRSILTEIYLCHACSCHAIEDGNAWTGIQATVDAFGATVGPLLFDKDERGVAEGALRWVRGKLASGQSATAATLTTNEAVALFDFAPEQPTDLALKVGMKLVLLETEGEWWRG